MTKNPYKVGDTVSIKRGYFWITGTIIKTVLARCHIKIGERVFVENYQHCKTEENHNG